jgi:hypothetical protein
LLTSDLVKKTTGERPEESHVMWEILKPCSFSPGVSHMVLWSSELDLLNQNELPFTSENAAAAVERMLQLNDFAADFAGE